MGDVFQILWEEEWDGVFGIENILIEVQDQQQEKLKILGGSWESLDFRKEVISKVKFF